MDFDPLTMMVLAALGVLIFGKRLPEIARKVGAGLSDVKRMIGDVRGQIEAVATGQPTTPAKRVSYEELTDYEESTAPKFEPPPRPALKAQEGS
jgi:sec-independent protein translocase protein TatA